MLGDKFRLANRQYGLGGSRESHRLCSLWSMDFTSVKRTGYCLWKVVKHFGHAWSHQPFPIFNFFFFKDGVSKEHPLRTKGILSPDRIVCRCRESNLLGNTGEKRPFPEAMDSPGPGNENDRVNRPCYRGSSQKPPCPLQPLPPENFCIEIHFWLHSVLGFIH